MEKGENKQVTDSITQANIQLIGLAPAVSMANLYQASAQALANAAHNASIAQQQCNVVAQAVTTQSVNMILSLKFR